MKSLSNSTALATALILIWGGSLLVVGCGKGGDSDKPVPADALAASDPDAKAKTLLAAFDALGVDDRQTWIQQNEFALAVFETAKDPELRARYQKDIAPLRGKR